MKKHLTLSFAAMLLGVCGALTAAESSESEAAMLATAKEVGVNAVGQDRSAETDENGNTKCQDANGNDADCKDEGATAKTQKTSEKSQQDDLASFKRMTGTKDVEMTSSPADASQTGSATISTENYFDFNCRLARAGSIFQAGAVGFKFENCAYTTLAQGTVQIQRAQFSLCDRGLKADLCSKPAHFNIPATLGNGAWVAHSLGQIGMSCTDRGQCRVTLRRSTTHGGNDQSLKEDAETANSNSELASNWRATGQSEEYQNQKAATTERLSDCAGEGNCEKVNEGIQEGAPSNTCSDVSTCLRYAEVVSNFNRTCERAFPVTERTVTRTYNAVASCDVVESSDPSVPSSTTCPSGPPAGYTHVGQTRDDCEEAQTPPATDTNGDGVIDANDTPPVNPAPGNQCAVKRYTAYYVDLGQVTESPPSYAPYPPAGSDAAACDLRTNSGTRFNSCQEWYGRTESACTVYFTDDSGASTHGEGGEVDYSQREGCGFCVKQNVSATCHADPAAVGTDGAVDQVVDSCEKTDLTGCVAVSAEPIKFSSAGGKVVAQRETYACEKVSRQCVEWSPTGSDEQCTKQDAAKGTDDMAEYRSSSGDSLTRAIQDSAQMESVAMGQENGSTLTTPGVYNGRDMRCRRPVGEVNERFTPNCCAADLQRPPEGSTEEDACTLAEAELAAARRSSYTHFVGEYCSRRFNGSGDASTEETNMNTSDRCIRQTETYCVFDSVLARLVQEQGRPQLDALAASSAGGSVQDAELRFGYLDDVPVAPDLPGGWTTPVVANGVAVAAYRWPHYCATTKGAMEALANKTPGGDCAPVVSTWFAACDLPGGCGALPADPSDGALHWRITSIDPLTNKTTAVSKLAVVTGACDPRTLACDYTVSTWPAGKGGRATVTRDLRWPLFGPQPAPGGTPSPVSATTSGIGDMMFRGYPASGAIGDPLPASVRLDLSRDGGATWRTYSVSPSRPSERQHLVDDIEVMGNCNQTSNYCEFRAVGTVAVEAKPWGTAIQPDCSGFTAGQLAVLDFSKMDLDEWTAKVMKENGREVDTAGLAARAPSEAAAAESDYNAGSVQARSPSSGNFARAVPAEGFGPFTATLQVSGFWPQVTGKPELDTDRVTAVRVSWGDCTDPEDLPLSSTGVGFEGKHLYQAPAQEGGGGFVHSCLGGNLERNLTHKVVLTVSTSRTGSHTTSLDVVNVWARFEGSDGENNANVNTTLESKPHGK